MNPRICWGSSMIKKLLKELYLPTHVALSFSIFVGSVIFAFCFGNPTWNYVQPDGSTSNYANIGATSSFAFVFAIWFIFDCFAHYEKDIKEKTKKILVLISHLGLIISLLVIYAVFLILRADFVVSWIYFLSFFLLEGLCLLVMYLEYRENEGKPDKSNLYILIGGAAIAFMTSLILAIILDYRIIFLFLIVAVLAGGFIGLEFFLKKTHKRIPFFEKEGSREKGLFIILFSAPMTISFLPIWVYSFKGYGEGYSVSWLILSLAYFLIPFFVMIASFIEEIGIKKRKARNTMRTTLSMITMFVGVIFLALAFAFYGNGSSYPLEACYYMVAVGFGDIIFGTIAFLYEELRRSNHEPKSE